VCGNSARTDLYGGRSAMTVPTVTNGREFAPPANARRAERFWENAYADQWRYLATNDTVEYQGKPVQGLALPLPILRKLYHDNAIKWFPGLVK